MMRKSILFIVLISISVIFAVPVHAESPVVTVSNIPADGVLELSVDETVFFDITVTSDVPFTMVSAMPDQYYPGRGIFFAGGDRARAGTEASLQLNMTGKSSTASLDGGVAPVSIIVAIRYGGGQVVVHQFDFVVVVS